MRDVPIHNWIPLGMATAFALVTWLVELPGGLSGNVALAAGMLAVGFAFFVKFRIGGGLAKFMVAASLWIGPNAVFVGFLAIMALGGVLLVFVARAIDGKVQRVPYSIVAVAAFLICLPQAPICLAMMSRLHRAA